MSSNRSYKNPVVFVQHPALTPVKVGITSNQTGTYWHGPSSSGVGASFTYDAGTLTIDGKSITEGDRVLLAGQTLGFQNGIYTCVQTGASGTQAVLVRSPDFQSLDQMHLGFFVPVSSGTTNGGSIFMLTDKPARYGVDNISFTKV